MASKVADAFDLPHNTTLLKEEHFKGWTRFIGNSAPPKVLNLRFQCGLSDGWKGKETAVVGNVARSFVLSSERDSNFVKATKADDDDINKELWNQRCYIGIFALHMGMTGLFLTPEIKPEEEKGKSKERESAVPPPGGSGQKDPRCAFRDDQLSSKERPGMACWSLSSRRHYRHIGYHHIYHLTRKSTEW
eukprot:1934107-Ditylum_brightwellii.AAC.1